MKLLTAAGLLCLLFALAGCKKKPAPTGAGAPDGGTPAATPGGASDKPKIAVGKATTFVTGPLDADGRVDYPAALNARLGKGVTADNNANVALWKALGPNPGGNAKIPPGYFEKMGTTAPPAAGDYFLNNIQFARLPSTGATGAGELGAEGLKRFGERPWVATDNPAMAKWLAANNKPLAAVHAATLKPQYYNPLVPETTAKGSKGLFSALLPSSQAGREIAGALACRAMYYTGTNQPAAAWTDLLACHRLGRLVARGGTLIESLVGFAIEQVACRADIAFLDRIKPDAKAIEGCLRDLRALPPMPDLIDKLDFAERFHFLETVTLIDKYGVGYLANAADGLPEVSKLPLTDDMLAGIDWNPVLKGANEWYDRQVAALREKDRATRNQKLTTIEDDLNRLRDALAGGGAKSILSNRASTAEARGAAVGNVFATLMIPAVRKVTDAADRVGQMHENVVTAFACAWYQRVNGRYPDALAQLAPTYLSAVPADIFTGKPLIYAGTAAGFAFHSVGPNGADDGGDNTPPRDDIGVRLPVPHKQ